MRRTTSPRSRRAFSLAEAVIALGIATMSLLGVVGLVPVALQSMRVAKEETAIARIATACETQARLMDFDTLSNSGGMVEWFDENAAEVSADDATRRYRASILTNPAVLPDASADPEAVTTPSLLSVRVEINAVNAPVTAKHRLFTVMISGRSRTAGGVE